MVTWPKSHIKKKDFHGEKIIAQFDRIALLFDRSPTYLAFWKIPPLLCRQNIWGYICFNFWRVSGMGTVLFTSSGEPYTSEERCNDVLDTFSAEDELNCSKCCDEASTNLLEEKHCRASTDPYFSLLDKRKNLTYLYFSLLFWLMVEEMYIHVVI